MAAKTGASRGAGSAPTAASPATVRNVAPVASGVLPRTGSITDGSTVCDYELIGAVMGDLSARRARVVGTDNVGSDRTCVKAEVRQTELIRYAVDLRSLTHGSGSFTRGFARYEPLSGSSGSSGSPGSPGPVAAHAGAIA